MATIQIQLRAGTTDGNGFGRTALIDARTDTVLFEATEAGFDLLDLHIEELAKAIQAGMENAPLTFAVIGDEESDEDARFNALYQRVHGGSEAWPTLPPDVQAEALRLGVVDHDWIALWGETDESEGIHRRKEALYRLVFLSGTPWNTLPEDVRRAAVELGVVKRTDPNHQFCPLCTRYTAYESAGVDGKQHKMCPHCGIIE